MLRKATLANAHSAISIWVQRAVSMLDLCTYRMGRRRLYVSANLASNAYVELGYFIL